MGSTIDSRRVRTLKGGSFRGEAVLYWVNRDKRVDDNWALIAAQSLAIKNKVPLIVCFQYIGEFPKANIRQYGFLFKGLEELRIKLQKLNIDFYLLKGKTRTVILKLIEEKKIGTLITDYSPLKIYKNRLKKVIAVIDIPTYQIDSHNIVPVWIASTKKEYSAYTIRKKIHTNLNDFLTEFPKMVKHPYGTILSKVKSYNDIISDLKIDSEVKEISWLDSGETAAKKILSKLENRLNGYNDNRNNPTKKALSNLSPYFHFGQLAPQRVALKLNNSSLADNDKNAFLEEMIVRRELSDNFCEYEPNYDYFEGFHPWAKKTLNDHRDDKREYLYTIEQFEEAGTHDELWNAGQNEMKVTGKMHGYMRMYWAKKILEWSSSPEFALQTAIDLNDKYELDGRDPNGYAGIAWSIGGIHDRAWFERPVYGKIRYMNYNGCKSKFNVKKYIETYGI